MDDIDNELIISSRSGTTTAIIGSLSGVNLSGDIDADEDDQENNEGINYELTFFRLPI